MIRHRECVGPTDSVATAEIIIETGKIPAVPVFDHAQVAGTLTEENIAERVPPLGRSAKQLKVQDVMDKDASIARGDEELEVAAGRMQERTLASLPVLNVEGKLIGVLPQDPDRIAVDRDGQKGTPLRQTSPRPSHEI